jgi:hypothetical protein
MYNRYRRNADEDIRELERAFYSGNVTVFERLIGNYIRSETFPLAFLLQNPEAFDLLPPAWQEQLRNITGAPHPSITGYCPPCQIPEHETCTLTPGCPCCEDTMLTAELYGPPEVEEEDDEEEEDAELLAAQEAGENWSCANCERDDLYEGNQGEEWALLTEAAAIIVEEKIGRGEGGQAMCESCLNEAGLDLEEAVQDELEGYCPDCGETEDDCVCE